ncbi:MAG: hypothetical protein LKE40_03700 [Spirochaetia bacterium]|jgi:hypothetical protein|nr:hypothetical protein [Spirochaetia bacterium]
MTSIPFGPWASKNHDGQIPVGNIPETETSQSYTTACRSYGLSTARCRIIELAPKRNADQSFLPHLPGLIEDKSMHNSKMMDYTVYLGQTDYTFFAEDIIPSYSSPPSTWQLTVAQPY